MRFYLQLSKVNSVTLMAWLKSRGLQCKSKDKKPELVAKVLCALNVRISEQWIEENKEISESALCLILLQSNCIIVVVCPSVKSGNKSQYKVDLNCFIGNETAWLFARYMVYVFVKCKIYFIDIYGRKIR